jgi:4-amino-4-deoxy-L-arabinose transferase-like glycosyltransferase
MLGSARLPGVALAGITGVFLLASWLGLDFGLHWDEPWRMDTLAGALRRGELLPNWYRYPSVTYDLLLVAASPEILVQALWKSWHGVPEDTAALVQFVTSQAFLLRARVLFVIVCAAGPAATYLLARSLGRLPLEAALAAALVGLSWEYGYHARWIAPDALLVPFAAGTLAAVALAAANTSTRCLYTGAALGGMACATKYPAGLLVVPLIAAALLMRQRPWQRLLTAGLGLLTFCSVYLLITPGTLLQYRTFATDVAFEVFHYGTRGQGGGHTLERGWTHLSAIAEYLALAVYSPSAWLSALLIAPWPLGVVVALRRNVRAAALVVAFPLLYAGYMMWQRVFIVRNYLLLVPCLAVLAACGWGWLFDRLRVAWGRRLLVAAAVGVLTFNAAWLVAAGWSVRARAKPVEAFAAWASTRSDVGVSRQLAGALGTVPAQRGTPEFFAFFGSEAANRPAHQAWHHAYVERWFGPLEVNYNYYPSWGGRDRIVVVKVDRARQLGFTVSTP